MGRYRFKLSDIMPNAWFYKLRDMTTTNIYPRSSKNPKPNKQKPPPSNISKHPKAPPPPPSSLIRDGPTYYNNINTPKKPPPQLYKKHRTSSAKSPRRRQQQQLISYNSSVNVSAASCTSCKSTTTSTMFMSYDQHELDHHQYSSSTAANKLPNVKHGNWSGSSCCCCCCRSMDSTSSDIILDMDHVDQKVLLYSDIDIIQHHDQPCKVIREIEQLDIIPLKPILTKPNNKTKLVMDHHQQKQQQVKVKVQVPPTSCSLRSSRPRSSEMGKFSVHGTSRKKLVGSSGHGFDLPRKSISIKGSQQQQQRRRRSYSESFAVVKNSSNPRRDFKESMVEMIVENEIKGSKDLEDLLACYLSLNSDEYHDDIVKVFEQVWLELRRDHSNSTVKKR